MAAASLLSRRQFVLRGLGLGLGGALGLKSGGAMRDHLTPVIDEQEAAWQDARAPSEEFLDRFGDHFATVHIGATFVPERLISFGIRASEEEAIDYLTDELGMRRIRIGHRWSVLEPAPGVLNTRAYARTTARLLSKPGTVETVIIGIKSPQEPEYYPPPHYEKALRQQGQFPHSGSTLYPDMPLAQRFLAHAERYLAHLRSEYGDLPSFQIENEAKEGFAKYWIKMSDDYLVALGRLVHRQFPQAAILFNTFGTFTFARAVGTLQRFRDDPELGGADLSLGLDFYEEMTLGPVLRYDGYAVDTISLTKLALGGVNGLRDYAEVLDARQITREITELQTERWYAALPWSHERQFPPGTLRHFQYMLLRSERNFRNTGPTVMRVWGIEQFLQAQFNPGRALTPDQASIVRLIQAINRQSTAHFL